MTTAQSDAQTSKNELRIRFGPVLVYGFATALAMWCIWFITHFPGMGLRGSGTGLALIATFVFGMVLAGRGSGRSPGWLTGLGAGLVTSVLNLLLLGSEVAKQAEGTQEGSQLIPQAGLVIAGFLLASAVVGLIAGFLGSFIRRNWGKPQEKDWLARFAIVSSTAVLALLAAGGIVTSSESGMAVPDWPGTYGGNMFLYPINLMIQDRVFQEHAHRLFGTFVGMCTLVLGIWMILGDSRRWIRILAALLIIQVVVQGILGGGRVVENNVGMGILHGILAQVFFGFMVAAAAALSPTYKETGQILPRPGDKLRRRFTIGFLHAMLVQLALGAAFRHLGHIHILWTHIVMSLVVVVFSAAAGFMHASGRPDSGNTARTFVWTGRWTLGVLGVQFLLGFAALWAVLSADRDGSIPLSDELEQAADVPMAEMLITTAHQANGAILLAMATLGFMWTRRVRRAAAAQAGSYG